MSAPRLPPGALRDRRDRGARGPRSLPGPLTPDGIPRGPTPAAVFDSCVSRAARRLRHHVGADLDSVEVGVEEVPVLPDDWDHEVPMSAHLAARGRSPARIVVYRMPVAGRARGRAETTALVLDLLVEEAAELLGRDPDQLDPRQR